MLWSARLTHGEKERSAQSWVGPAIPAQTPNMSEKGFLDEKYN